MEYEDLAGAVLPILMEQDLAVMSFEMTEKKFYLKVVNKAVERKLAAAGGHFGDRQHNIVRCLSPAVTISDSEVGYGSANVLVGLYDSFCSNLATFGERSVRRHHVGGKHELVGDYTVLSQETKQLTAKATIARSVTSFATLSTPRPSTNWPIVLPPPRNRRSRATTWSRWSTWPASGLAWSRPKPSRCSST